MLRKLAICFAVVLAAANFIACNSTYESIETAASCAAVSSFTLTEDDSVMENLDSVFFSIDLNNGRIFNADSLPCGTNVTKLIPVISTLEGSSLIELTVKRDGKADTTYNYTSNANDSIDFTYPVTMRVVSPDGLNERKYQVKVNVHKIPVDTLTWSNLDSWRLPTDFARPQAQKSAIGKENLYTLTSYSGAYCLGYYQGVHELGHGYLDQAPCVVKTLSLPFTPDVESFTATDDDNLYVLATDGTLYHSSNMGADWEATSHCWQSIIGVYQGALLGITRESSPRIVDLGRGTSVALPAGMPVSGSSIPVYYDFPMASTPQLMIVGGRCLDGSLSADTWGYDGNSWARISKRTLPEGLEGVVTVPYYTFTVAGNLVATEVTTLFAFGGRRADGTLSKVVYQTTDFGFNWAEAADNVQLPEALPAMYSAQAFVLATTMSADVTPGARRRISTPLESWTCPYIYLFGGRDAAGATYNTIWRGVITRMSLKPVE